MIKKVLVAMSGGVDSSVAAALLQKQGYFVVGGYMKNFSQESWSGVVGPECPWQEDILILREVCDRLGITLKIFNFEREYREKVIEYFFGEYAAGRTPNPDIICNSEVKFGLFLDKARELGVDYVATGHYARVKKIPSLRAHAKQSHGIATGLRPRDERFLLLKGLDPNKDQSYFLYRLNQHQLSRSLFPVGEYAKPQIRQLARKFNLPNAERKDSQGLCFIGHINLREFLKQRIPERVGETVTTSGEVIGKHQGAAYYTIGQRHGLGIGGGTPYYVAKKDLVNNIITVTKGRYHRLVYDTRAKLENIHWINEAPKLPLRCKAKIRYRQNDQECVITEIPRQSAYQVTFRQPQFAPAPGQSIVLYDDDKVLGGGIIG